METKVQEILDEYDELVKKEGELLKTKKEYEAKKEEYEQKIEKQSLIRTEDVFTSELYGCRSPLVKYSYIGKEEAVKEITDDANRYSAECITLNKKIAELETMINKRRSFLERISILFTGKIKDNCK